MPSRAAPPVPSGNPALTCLLRERGRNCAGALRGESRRISRTGWISAREPRWAGGPFLPFARRQNPDSTKSFKAFLDESAAVDSLGPSHSSLAQSVEQAAVNRRVQGSSP